MVVGDQIHDGSRHLNLRSEDGASFFVPAWMTQEEASAVKIVDAPCLSLGRLLELCAFVDSVLASQAGKRPPLKEASMAMRRMFPQPDLFETPPPRIALAPAQRTKLVDQLRVLLMEAMAISEAAAGAQDRLEAGDDEDHA
jgi:hypothetical protein